MATWSNYVPFSTPLGERLRQPAPTRLSQVHGSVGDLKFINSPNPLQTQPQCQASAFTSQCPWDGRGRCHSLPTWRPRSRTRLQHQLQGPKNRSLHRRRWHRKSCHHPGRSRSRWMRNPCRHSRQGQILWMRRTSRQSLRNDGSHGSRWSRSCRGIRSSCCGSTSAALEANTCRDRASQTREA